VLDYSAVATGVRFLPLSLVTFAVSPIAGRVSARLPVRFLLSAGLALVGLALLLMSDVKLGSSWTTLLAGFIVAGIGIGLVNPPLAATAVSVVEPRRAGMASGINNTFRQIGIATGIAALGAIFQSRIASHLVSAGFSSAKAHELAPQIATSGQFQSRNPATSAISHASFISGLDDIFFVAAFLLFAGAILALLLVRRQDFVASAPQAAAEAG
jgi:hypothetical protein